MKPEARARTEAWLEYFDALGISPFCIDPAAPSTASSEPIATVAEGIAHPVWAARAATSNSAPVAQPVPVLPVIKSASLFAANDRVEGPGHDEDVQGLPFVGRAGKLLTQMIEAMGLRRDDVYIANVVKCRQPQNRAPEPDEIATCSPFLYRQIAVIRPKAVVCLGAIAFQSLTGTKQSISRLRGQWLDFRGTPLMLTYHPAYLLRNPNAKGDVWEDLKKVMAHLGLKLPAKR